MPPKDGAPEKQHYVPKLLLREFASRKKTEWYIYVFDKHTDATFQTNIDNVAAERGFYEIFPGEKTLRVEELLSFLETKTADAFKKLIHHRNLREMEEEDRAWIGLFPASQHTRVKNFREMILDTDRQFRELLITKGHNPDEVEGLAPLKDEEELKKFAVYFLIRSMGKFAEAMIKKIWFLMEADSRSAFWLGDNPVTLHNDKNFGPYGNIGFEVPGIQIYLPIAKNLTLAFWCRSLLDDMRRHEERLKAILTVGMDVDRAVLQAQLQEAQETRRKIEVDGCLQIKEENVTFLKSLQVQWAERYVMSSSSDFSLVQRMLEEFPKSRRGIRTTVG